MASTNIVRNLCSNVLNSDRNNESQNYMEMEFHSQFSTEENSLNGLCMGGVYIPEEIILNIFLYLKPKDILNCSLVCKRWCNIAKSNILWQNIYNIKEYPLKAKNLPWYVFYCYYTTDDFKNLLKNGNGQEQFKYWNIISNGGDQFKIEDPPTGSDPLPEGVLDFNGYTSCFATSFQNCSKYQKIEISPKRLLRYIIKKYKPTLYLSEWYSARSDCASTYRLTVRCDTKDNKWLREKPRGFVHPSISRNEPTSNEFTVPYYLKFQKDQIEQWVGREWKKMELTTENYPTNVDTIYFCHEGQDCQYWRGHYGSKMAGGVLKFLFDSIKPIAEDIAENEILQN